MAITRRQIYTVLSALVDPPFCSKPRLGLADERSKYLLALTGIAAYALHLSNAYSLPIANVIPALTVALPPLIGIALESVLTFRAQKRGRTASLSSTFFHLTIGAFLVYEAVLATLAGIHLAPSGSLTCGLRERWLTLYRAKNGKAIASIQDAFQCCGLASPLDMAFPFKDKTHGDNTCMVRYERRTGCLGAWNREERKVVVILASSSDWSRLPSTIRLPDEPEASRTIAANSFRHIEDADSSDGADTLRAETSRLNKDSTIASHVEGVRVRPSPLRQPLEEGDHGRQTESATNVWS
nr:hypothetical protein CFP56_56446 [Quercus suber]